jgi:rubrerythrin
MADDDYDFICMDCGELLEGKIINAALYPPEKCPVCGSTDIVSIKQTEENERINAEENE